MSDKRYQLEFTSEELYDMMLSAIAYAHPTEFVEAAEKIIGKLPPGHQQLRCSLWEGVGTAAYARLAEWNGCHEEGDPFYDINQNGSPDPKDWDVIEVEEEQARF